MTKRPAERREELEFLRRLCDTLVDAIPYPPEIARAFHDAIETAFRRGSLSQLRMGRDDLEAMIENAIADDPDVRRRLDTLLRERLGITADDALAKRRMRIERIRERGRIVTETQYYLVREHVELIWEDEARADEFRTLQAMLADFETRAGLRAQRRRKDDSST